jgi:hypothetical protein
MPIDSSKAHAVADAIALRARLADDAVRLERLFTAAGCSATQPVIPLSM